MVKRKKFRRNAKRQRSNNDTKRTSISKSHQRELSVTPGGTPPQHTGKSKSQISIKSTPVNKKLANSRRRTSSNHTMNVTNLNILFDSSHINQNTPSQSKRRNNDFVSPKTNGDTQAINKDEFKRNLKITETPKVSQVSFTEDFVSQISSPKTDFEERSKIYYHNSQLNLNSYLQNSEVKFVNHDPSDSHLHNLMLALTPIEKIATNIFKNSSIKESPNNVSTSAIDQVKVDKILNFGIQLTPKINNIDQENFINCIHLKTVSPKTHNPKEHNFSQVSEANSGYQTISSSTQKKNKKEGLEVVFDELRRLSRTWIRWFKIADWCSYIGVAIRKILTSFCQHPKTTVCESLNYIAELESCKAEIQVLRSELIKTRVQAGIQETQEIKQLAEQLQQIKKQFNDLRDFKIEYDYFKKHLKQNQTADAPVCATSPPPPPPPPPPPLPPLKLMPKQKKVSNDSNKENSRTVISLDEILSVQLKKPSERPLPYRRSSQPIISTEMLQQIKLRPVTKIQAPASTVVSTSPSSTLIRLLIDNSVPKVKRLKNMSGASFEDHSRRNKLFTSERERAYN